jgi:aspartate kinase
MSLIVQKFGGTSVKNLECMQQVMTRVKDALAGGNKVIAVLSAMSGETNRLIEMAKTWSAEPDAAEMDVLLATGEQTSISLFSMLLLAEGIKARSILGFQAQIDTDCSFGKARIMGINGQGMRDMLKDYDVLVVAGFQGCDEKRRITTLGRGGSDTSAVAIAVAAEADVCEIYTDVDGVYTTDPNMCSKARKIIKISYDEMLEMASMGAKVLQIRSVEFAKKYSMPVHVRSTFNMCKGTLVSQEDQDMESVLVSGIAYDKDQARVTVENVSDRPGIAASIFGPLAEAGVVVDMIIQNVSREGATDMTFTIPRGDLKNTLIALEDVKKEIGAENVHYNTEVAKVSVIGVGMRNHSGVASRMFQALEAENINIRMISTSEIKVTCLIEEKYVELAVRALHDVFELEKEPEGGVC